MKVVESGVASAAGREKQEEVLPAPPAVGSQEIESRFLYVDVAAQRAKQLRRGALPRLDDIASVPVPDPSLPGPKFERVAMREVDAGKVHYELPDDEPAHTD